MRLGAMFGLLIICAMLIARTRNPEMWRWFAREREEAGRIEHVGDPPEGAKAPGGEAKPSGAPAKADAPAEGDDASKGSNPQLVEKNEQTAPESPAPVAKPAAEGTKPAVGEQPAESEEEKVTDEDPDEWVEAQEEFQAIYDGQLRMRPEEWNAFKRVLAWVYFQPAETLLKRATRNVPYDDFLSEPGKHRGKIYALNLNMKLCRRFPEPVDGDLTLYEAWGVTQQSKTFLYDAIILDPPKGFPISDTAEISEKATVVGYFFKVQGYKPGRAKPNAPPELAPMFIGRLVWKPVQPVSSSTTEWYLGAIVGGAAVVVVVFGWMFSRVGGAKTASDAILAASRGSRTLPVGDWLDDPEANEPPQDEGGGNNSDSQSELQEEEEDRRPDAEQGRRPRDGLDEGRSSIG